MKLERCEQSSERKRLSGYLQPRAVSTGMSSGGLFMFGLPFVGIGTWATLAGTRQIPIDPSKLHAPYWVLATVGAAFLLCGVMLWRMGWKQSKADDRRRRVMADRHADPALADYAWDVRGYSSSRWWPVVRSIVLAVLFGGLITALHMSAVTGTN